MKRTLEEKRRLVQEISNLLETSEDFSTKDIRKKFGIFDSQYYTWKRQFGTDKKDALPELLVTKLKTGPKTGSTWVKRETTFTIPAKDLLKFLADHV